MPIGDVGRGGAKASRRLAAQVLGLTIAAFSAALPRLQNRGFPEADPDTGN